MDERINTVFIGESDSILNALKQMDKVQKKLLIVRNQKEKLIGLLSLGDIQRAIIRGVPLDDPLSNILRETFRVGRKHDSIEFIKAEMKNFRIEFMPIIDDKDNIIDILFWEDIFEKEVYIEMEAIKLPVVIMAGGEGKRLRPLTNVLPKPLIPIGERSIIEDIFYKFNKHQCNDFIISVNHKAEMIEYYLKSLDLPYNLSFIKENEPTGTAGSLSMLKGKINQTFFVSNCDILIEEDYSEILKYHYDNDNEITVVAILKNYSIPYGTIKTGSSGQLIELLEKPDITFMINSGMYILEPSVLLEIPQGEIFHITQLINKIKDRSGKIGVFPVSEGSWHDIGTWNEYLSKVRH